MNTDHLYGEKELAISFFLWMDFYKAEGHFTSKLCLSVYTHTYTHTQWKTDNLGLKPKCHAIG